MSASKKSVEKSDVEVELADIYDATGTTEDDLLPAAPEQDSDIMKQFCADFDYVMVFPMMGEGQTPFNPKEPHLAEQVRVVSIVFVCAACNLKDPYSRILNLNDATTD